MVDLQRLCLHSPIRKSTVSAKVNAILLVNEPLRCQGFGVGVGIGVGVGVGVAVGVVLGVGLGVATSQAPMTLNTTCMSGKPMDARSVGTAKLQIGALI